MSVILITGTSGFVGKALAESFAKGHSIVCMSRKPTDLDCESVEGNFAESAQLAALDKYDIGAVVHLAAVTGGCSEEDGMAVNVEGTRVLMRYLIDRGCKKFVMASSIAAVGMQREDFLPEVFPIPDDHPCYDRDGYGFSKYMMEEVTKYYWRQNPDIDVINLRLSSVVRDEPGLSLSDSSARGQWLLGRITQMVLSDAVRAFSLAVESVHKPGVRILNTCGPEACVSEHTSKVLRAWLGQKADISYFDVPGNEYASVYDPSAIKEELGFVAQVLPSRALPAG